MGPDSRQEAGGEKAHIVRHINPSSLTLLLVRYLVTAEKQTKQLRGEMKTPDHSAAPLLQTLTCTAMTELAILNVQVLS